jgi:hypothetical protein
MKNKTNLDELKTVHKRKTCLSNFVYDSKLIEISK